MIENSELIQPTPKKFNKAFLLIIPLIIIISAVLFFINKKSNPITTNPEVSTEPEISYPVPTSILNLQATALATDPAVLKTKQDIEDNINNANTIDLSETNLSFPILDFSIGFQ